MATIKSYTDISQSRKLAEILPIESADMYWFRDDVEVPRVYPKDMMKDSISVTLPCWSLVALLGVLLNPKVYQGVGGNWYCECWKSSKDVKNDGSTYIGCTKANNPIDACYEMIIKLHELNLL